MSTPAGAGEVTEEGRPPQTAAGEDDDRDGEDTDEESLPDPEIDRSPAYHSSVASIALALVGATSLSLGSIEGGAAALVGALVLGGGLWIGRRRIVTLGALIVGLGIAVAGVLGAGPEPLLLAGFSTVLAWDLGETAIDLGETVGRDAPTLRLEAVHAAGSVSAGALTIVVGYGTFLAVGGGQPVTALVLLLFGAVVIVSALR